MIVARMHHDGRPEHHGGQMERRQFLQSTMLGAAATILGAAPSLDGAAQPLSSQEDAMSDQIRGYEPLTSENAALVLVDHQIGLMTGVRDYSTGELKHNVVALAKAAKALKLPIVVTTTARDSMWGPTFPELAEAQRPRAALGHGDGQITYPSAVFTPRFIRLRATNGRQLSDISGLARGKARFPIGAMSHDETIGTVGRNRGDGPACLASRWPRIQGC
jgi:hypothetical protein